MEEYVVKTQSGKYTIYFTSDFRDLPEALKKAGLMNRKVCIVTDQNVDQLYGQEIENILQPYFAEISKFAFTPGEAHKNMETIEQMYRFFIENHLDRSSFIIALGGGVVGDMAGFAASTYMRGIPFVQVPTSLLAQVDSSVGGKVGIDFLGHKNIVGSFYQPRFVYINVRTLKTLPAKEFYSGMGEVIKHGLILDREYYQMLVEKKEQILKLESEILKNMVRRSCELKVHVVSQDEKEAGLREILNFGHTIGHAVETLFQFQLLHGECVAIGMTAAAYISMKKQQLAEEELKQIEETIKGFHLPTRIQTLCPEQIYNQLFLDKKTRNNQLNFVLLKDLGQCYRTSEISKEEIIEAIQYILQS